MTRMEQAQGNNIKILVHGTCLLASLCLSYGTISKSHGVPYLSINLGCPILIRLRVYLQLTVNTTCSVSRHLDLNHLVRQRALTSAYRSEVDTA